MQRRIKVSKSAELDGLTLFFLALFCLFVLILPMCSSGKSDRPKEDAFGSAREKIDKGIPLNEREAKSVEKFLNRKEDEEAARIEKKHGLR